MIGCNPATYGIFSFSEESHYTLSAEPLLTGRVKLTTELCPVALSSFNQADAAVPFDPGVPPQQGQAGI